MLKDNTIFFKDKQRKNTDFFEKLIDMTSQKQVGNASTIVYVDTYNCLWLDKVFNDNQGLCNDVGDGNST